MIGFGIILSGSGGWGGGGKVEEEVGSLLAGLLDALLAGVEGAFAFCFCGHFGARFGVCGVLALAWGFVM